jgi:hypothetical protein
MDWAEDHIKRLRAGETVTFRPRGRSMEPLVMDNQEVTVEPVNVGPHVRLEVGDIVLCRVGRRSYLHLVKRCNQSTLQYQIGNNKGRVNGWVRAEDIFGRMV